MSDQVNAMPSAASSPADALLLADSELLAAIQKSEAQQASALAAISAQVEALAKRPLKISDFDMPFGSLVGFIVKVAIASIPAGLILGVLYLLLILVFGGFLGALGRIGR